MAISSMIRSRFRFAGDLARAADVARVLGKYGLAQWLAEVEWAPFQEVLKSHGGEVLTDMPFEARVRLALTDLGTTFIKLGQVLSTRPHLVGEALAGELSKLQQDTPPDPPEAVIQMVQHELGRPIEECFKEFEAVAEASASIGQVHRARLMNGRAAIVKVQHAGIEGTIRRDLDILRLMADIAERNARLRAYQPAAVVREFSRTILKELDFAREMRNLQAFRRNFAEDETVCFPKPYPELTTGRVLTMERLRGHKVTDDQALDKLEFKREELALRGANVFIEMIFRDGFYHADPHPGNFMVMPDGTIGLLDAGMVGRLDDPMRMRIAEVLLAAGDRDAERLTDAVLRISGTPEKLDRAVLSADLTDFFDEYGTQAVGQFNVSGALTAITVILHDHKLMLPGNISMLIKCLILLEGTGRLLNPAFNLAEVLEPWRKKFVRQRFSPRAQAKQFRRLFVDWERAAEALPKVTTRVLDRLEQGHFAIHLEHQHLKSAVNRLVVGLFISSLLVGSAILIASDVPPMVWGVSVPGMLGYIAAVVFGIRTIWINRDKFVQRRTGDWD